MNNEKIKCQLCGTEVNSVKGISTHLRYCVNNQGENKLSPEDYYLKYINPEKGKCKVCGKDTKFRTITTGYAEMCSSSCAGKSYNQLGITSKREKHVIENGVECKLCNRIFKSIASLRNHVTDCKNNTDKWTTREYYDRFEKKIDEGTCKCCGKETKFKGLEIGYDKYCGPICVNHHARKDYNEKKNKEIIKRLNDHGFELENDVYTRGEEKVRIICKNCGRKFTNTIFNILKHEKHCCQYCKIKRPISGGQSMIYNYILEKFDDTAFMSYTDVIKNMEVDIFVPKFNITIEYNGLFWHNTEINKLRDKWKTAQLVSKGFKHINIWENECSMFFDLDFDFIYQIINNIIHESYDSYKQNIEYYTFYTMDELNIELTKQQPKIIGENTATSAMSSKVRPPYKPINTDDNQLLLPFGEYHENK